VVEKKHTVNLVHPAELITGARMKKIPSQIPNLTTNHIHTISLHTVTKQSPTNTTITMACLARRDIEIPYNPQIIAGHTC